MPFCRNCGLEISSSQDSSFSGLCPECVRQEPLERVAKFFYIGRYVSIIGSIIVGIVFIFIIFSLIL